jgi:hypothetical protein
MWRMCGKKILFFRREEMTIKATAIKGGKNRRNIS